MKAKVSAILVCILYCLTAPGGLIHASIATLEDSWHCRYSPFSENKAGEIHPAIHRIPDYSGLNNRAESMLSADGLEGDPGDDGGFLGGGGGSSEPGNGLGGDPGDTFVGGIERAAPGDGTLPLLFLVSVYLLLVVRKRVSE